ncbi:aryl-sulfate sulfotransferase [Desulfotomaculum sp. 1211_IL3151]|uniref:aryl-sulfate sulfotransferase n=1 Tax=Desulfotomaculum sp. 1211_IL3151 TaxID=3084055 RepID=UPI002FDA7DE8
MSTIKYQNMQHIITMQHESEQRFLEEFAQGNYTLANPLVKLNPYFIAPLTAMVLFETPIPVEVTIIVKGIEVQGNISHRFPRGTRHIIPVYGLYGDWENEVELVLSTGERNTIIIKTDKVDERVPHATSCKTTSSYFGDNLVFMTASMKSVPVGYDYRGDLRWYSPYNFAFDLKRIDNGHILVGTERLVGMPYYTTGIYEMNLGGKVFKEYRIPGGYHHDHFQMKDGNLLILTEDLNSSTVEDMCVLIDKQTGEILKSWDFKNILPQYPVAGSGTQDAEDWFHNNAVWYDEETNSLLLSGRHQDAVINIDFQTGKLNWILGDPEGWPEEYQQYFFKPVGDLEKFDWQYEQHACVLLPNRNIFLFDNGHWRSKNKEHYVPNSKNFSCGVIYRIDTDKMEIEQIWQYGKERGAEFFSPYVGNVEYYNDGHYLIHSGGIGYQNGKTCEGMAVNLVRGPEKDTISFNSITCELLNNEVVYELQVPANFYRAEKLPLYYANEVAEFGKGQLLGSLGVSKEFRVKVPAESKGLIPDHYDARIWEEEDRIQFSAIFSEGEDAFLILRGEDGCVHKYHIKTTGADHEAMCVGTFQKENPQDIDKFISKEGLKGIYKVEILCEGTLYTTNVTIQA